MSPRTVKREIKTSTSPTPSSPLSSPEPQQQPDTSPSKRKKKTVKQETAESHLSAAAIKKLSLYSAQLRTGTPFPHWQHPTPAEAQLVQDRLASVHGQPQRPKTLIDRPGQGAGCGENPDVLDALIRTILSQNTTSKNSTRAKLSMDEKYGRAQYRKVLEGGEELLEETIRCGGLAKQKSKSIIGVLRRIDEKNRNDGKPDEELSLDFLHNYSDEDAMRELISYDLVGIKTASCVLLFCLGRSSFAVDTHVHRLSQSLGWLPPTGSVYTLDDTSDPKNPPTTVQKTKTSTPPTRDQTFYHLDSVLPDENKYPLHSLLVRHGRGCVKCAANGVTTQDIVDHCPIEDLIVRGKAKKGKVGSPMKMKKKEVKVEDEDGNKVGVVKEDEEGHVEVDVKEEEEEKVGKRNRTVKSEEEGEGEVAVEDEVKQTKRPTRASKRASSSSPNKVKYEEEEEEDEEEEDIKPSTKRPRITRRSSSTLSESLPQTKKTTSRGGKGKATTTKAMSHSVDRDEAEMSGRAWKDLGEGAMHGLDG